MPASEIESVDRISKTLLVVRNQRVILDAVLAELYGVETRRLNEQVRRNRRRFPADFLLELTANEFANLKSQIATSSWGGRRKPPLAFTEHGAIMAATILNTPQAVQMSVYVVRAFVSLRDFLASNDRLALQLRELEKSLMRLDLHTQRKFTEVYQAIQSLRSLPAPKKRPIGFARDPDEES